MSECAECHEEKEELTGLLCYRCRSRWQEKEMQELRDEIERLRERVRNDDDQFTWLSKWCQERFRIDTNAAIGRCGWPKTLVEVVAYIVDMDRLKREGSSDG